MKRLIGLIGTAASAVLMWPFRRRPGVVGSAAALVLPAPRRARSPVPAIRTATGSQAVDMVPHHPVPATAEAVETLFKPVRQDVETSRREAYRLSKVAEKALATGHVDPALIAETEAALADVAATIERAESMMDQLAFETPSDEHRWWRFIEDIHEVEAQIEVAMSDFCIVHANAHVFR
ncbi:MAG: hypothetical protein V7704_20710 [Aurantimonas endophytica]|uniref:hypothetical protein n=1 Tax=Aurantimonas endophytica TaxID=1522175 RepID=UPI00300156DA